MSRGELAVASTLPLGAHPLDSPDPPTDLTPESFAETLYVALAPLARQDPDYDWSLLILCNAIGAMYQLLDDLERDTPEGPGWSPLVDLNRCPDDALPWLAQFVGVRLLPDTTPAEQRARILATDGWRRGTREAIESATAATLTGTKSVVVRERDGGDAYALRVQTLVRETPDSAATLSAILSQKPAGIVLTYQTLTGQDYQTVKTTNANYTAVKTKYATYTGMTNDTPGA